MVGVTLNIGLRRKRESRTRRTSFTLNMAATATQVGTVKPRRSSSPASPRGKGLQALSGLLGRPGAALLISSDFWYRLPQLAAVLVVAVIWRVLFRRTGFNFFEMVAIAVYAFAQLVLVWTVFALVVGLLPIQSMSLFRWGAVLQALLGFALAFHTGWKVFRENALLVAFKTLVAAAIPFEVLAALDSILRHR